MFRLVPFFFTKRQFVIFQLFPLANYVGAFLSPPLKRILGDDVLELVDNTADFFCVSVSRI